MATSTFGAATASAAPFAAENAHNFSNYLPFSNRHFFLHSKSSSVSFRLSTRLKLRIFSKGLQTGLNSSVVKAKLKEAALGGSIKASASTAKSDVSPATTQSGEPTSDVSINEFIAQVTSLVKMVDSKDIVELKLKQLDCEILIRKKEALPLPPSPPTTHIQPQPQLSAHMVSTPSPAPEATPSPPPTAAASPPKAQSTKSSHRPVKCPMAGTFYRCPAPGEPPLVKVGDKVQKGQILCIIEAMKLMNEIEADQSGTIVEIVAEDGKPVSIDTPLFMIEP